MSEDQGRPVKTHRSGGGYPYRTLENVIAATPLPNYTEAGPVRCAVRGVLQGGKAMCGSVIMGGEFCGHATSCEHQRIGPKKDA